MQRQIHSYLSTRSKGDMKKKTTHTHTHTQRNLPRLEKRAKRQMEMHCNPLENSLTTEV